jgi:hypothetical protein
VTCGRTVFYPGTPVSSTNKTDRQDITEILLKVALNIITPTKEFYFYQVLSLQQESRINGTNVNVTRVMDTWIEQKNYPLLNVTITTNGMIVTQQRFLLGERSNSTQK